MPIPSVQAIEKQLGTTLLKAAPDRDQLRRSRYCNNYLLDADDQVIGLHLGEEIKGTLVLGEAFRHLQLLKIKSPQLWQIVFEADMPDLDLLDLSECDLESFSLPSGFQSLKIMILHHNPIQNFELRGEELAALEIVDLSHTPLPEIRLTSRLPKLGYVYAYGGKLQHFAAEQNLPELQVLELRKSQLKQLRLEHCPRMERLDLEDLQLTAFPPDLIHKLPALQTLVLKGNPIENIQRDIFDQGDDKHVWEDVKNHFKAIEQGGETINNEVKVIFIGNGSVGKTQIARRLAFTNAFEFKEEHESTHAISLLRRNLDCDFLREGLLMNLWDFGGQDIYHATHRMFMQTRALFVLVWDIENESMSSHSYKEREYKNEKLGYWLAYATCFGQDSPVLVLQNKIDTDRDDHKLMPPPTQNEYKKQFPIIEKFLGLSAKSGRKFSVLEDYLAEVFDQNDTLKKDLLIPIAVQWVAVRDQIRKEQSKDDKHRVKKIDQATFEFWCSQASVKDQASSILRFLHNTGVLYYREGFFEDNILLDQGWAIEGVYQIFDKESKYFELLEESKGKIHYKHLCKIWKEYTDSERELFIEFMLNAELCFETTPEKDDSNYSRKELKERSFIVPQLLHDQKPAYLIDSDFVNKLTETYEIPYRFLPAVFMHRFIVRASDFILGEKADSIEKYIWQQGMYIVLEGRAILIEAVYGEEQKIIIHHQAQDRSLALSIEQEINEIAQEGNIKLKPETPGKEDAILMGERYLRGLEKYKKENKEKKSMNQNNHQRADDLNKAIREAYELLSELEQSHMLSLNPIERTRFNKDIQRQKETIENYQTELKKLLNQSDDIGIDIQKEILAGIDRLEKGQVDLKQGQANIIAHLSETKQSILKSIDTQNQQLLLPALQKITEEQANYVTIVAQKENELAEIQTETIAEEIWYALEELQEGDSAIMKQLQSLKTEKWQTKIKFGLPFLLSFEAEVGLNDLLKKTWQKINKALPPQLKYGGFKEIE
ncbi:MAG: COR domain-containing protein [Microscillaceae bacterium]|nr:COR domain-containing protein [Microscillaceae bacterium]